jgi:transitional endoplasmic reticulum ATPase
MKDRGKGLVRIDGHLRNRLDVGINDSVEITKVQSKNALNVTLAPTEPLVS